ncbi:MAG: RAD55 family ATPase [Byssovorax sp.]
MSATDDDPEREAIEREPPMNPLERAIAELGRNDDLAALAALAALEADLRARESSPEARAQRDAGHRALVLAALQNLGSSPSPSAVRDALGFARVTLAATDQATDVAALCRAMARRPTLTRLTTGIATLDAACRGGIPAGRRVVLLGAPGAGKTALAVQWAHTWAHGGARVVYLAMDQDPEATLVRLGQREGFCRDDLEGVTGPEAKGAAWIALADRLAGKSLLVLDGADVTLESALLVLRAPPESEARVIMIDSLQTIRCLRAEGAESPRARMDAILDLLRSASAEGISVVAVSEMVRGGYAGGDASPTAALAAAKESGSIEFWADVLLALRSARGEPDLSDVEVAKNRLGPRVEVRLRLDRARAALAETERPPAEDRARGRTGAGSGPEALERRILDAVRSNDLRNPSAVYEKIGGTKGKVLAAVRDMLDGGRLASVAGRLRAVVGEGDAATERAGAADDLARFEPVCEPSEPVRSVRPPTGARTIEPSEAMNEAKQAIRAVASTRPIASFAALRGRVGKAFQVMVLRGAWDDLRGSGELVQDQGRGSPWVLATPLPLASAS